MSKAIINGLEYDTEKSTFVGTAITSPGYFQGSTFTADWFSLFRTPSGRYFTRDHNELIEPILDESHLSQIVEKSPGLYRKIFGEPTPA